MRALKACRSLARQLSTTRALNTQPRSSADIRRAFVEFFERAGHVFVPSSSLQPPPEDSSILFTNAGMNQFKRTLAGLEARDAWPPRVVNYQKCIRAGGRHNDLDDVGRDLHHLSFFEMLGNWSFYGAYDKSEACRLAWSFLTDVIGIPAERLYVTYFGGSERWRVAADGETREIWLRLGLPAERILPFVEENFWEMGRVGSCGASTEIHYDRIGNRDAAHLVNRDDSVIELWNVVFTNMMRQEDGSLTRQADEHVDTGLGFERLVSVVQGAPSNYDTDLFAPMIERIHKAERYGGLVGASPDAQRDVAYRIVADHVRGASMALADGMQPGAEDAGFVIRKMIRRAAWRGRALGLEHGALRELVPEVVESLSAAYPSLGEEAPRVAASLAKEEAAFWKLVARSEKLVKKALAKENEAQLGGEALFRLHDAHGVSPDIVEMWTAERGVKLDVDGYERRRQEAKAQSRKADTKKQAVRA